MTTPGRNDLCPCGSGKKYKQCCQLHPAAPAKNNSATTIQAALEHHRSGRLTQAEEIYKQVLHTDPAHPDALHYLGALTSAQGKYEEAVGLISRAIGIKPSRSMHYNLGNAFRELKKLDEAAESYRHALALDPNYAEAHSNLGSVLLAQGKAEEAVESFRRALAIKPGLVETHSNLGNALKTQGKLNEAIECFRHTLDLDPRYADAYFNLGNVLYAQSKHEAAIEPYRKAISLKPGHIEAHYNLGNVLFALDKMAAAIESYRNVLALKPDHIEALIKTGSAFVVLSNFDSAIEYFRKALALKPDYAEAYNYLGYALKEQGSLETAIEASRKALALKPDYADAYSNLLFLHGYHITLDHEAYLAEARGWELACVPAEERLAARSRVFSPPPLDGRRLKVGYVSGDYRKHAVSNFIEQLFASHNRARVELFAYSVNRQEDAVTTRIKVLPEHWVPVYGNTVPELYNRIRNDGIDVLVDLSGHTGHNRMEVFARRAAPVQIHYLGYFASTGLTEMDYLIGDRVLTPPELDWHFTERIWRLPRVRASYNSKSDAPPTRWQPDKNGTIWIGSFNNLGKLTPATLALWAKVLHALPQARLLLKTKEFTDEVNRHRILNEIGCHGIPIERVELNDSSSTLDWKEHMAYYDRLDIALDPVGAHGGYTTTCDALWMAVPVIAMIGDRMASRMTSSILDAVGHPEWVANSEAEYVDKVVALANNAREREALRFAQRERMTASPLCDAKDLAKEMENAYLEMFRLWQKKQRQQ